MKPRKGYRIDDGPYPWELAVGLGLMLALILGAAAVILELGGLTP